MDRENKRHIIQTLWAVITNSNIEGFKTLNVYKGATKHLCVPGMNCYSCPGARASCPIGAMQAVIGGEKFGFSFYIWGFLIFLGALFGRFACGYLCPFGLIQEFLNKIPFVKKIGTFKGDKFLRKLKYVFLIMFVIILPMFFTDSVGIAPPYFCKLVCPVGTLEGGVPLVIFNEAMRGIIGFLFMWKFFILIAIIILSVIIYRPFCKYICPLGAIYSIFNPIAIFRYRADLNKCIDCGKCERECKMQCDPIKAPNSPECVHCEKCVEVCPVGAIKRSTK